MIYLDNCATTRVKESVLDAMVKAMTEDYANPSSLHTFGLDIEKKIRSCRQEILDFLHGSGNLYFTSGATEGNNTIIRSFSKDKPQGIILTSPLEHASLKEPIQDLKNQGFQVKTLKVDSLGNIDLGDLKEKVDQGADLLALTHVNSELGNILPLDRVLEIIEGRAIHFHLDGVQAFGKIPVNLKGVDSYVFSGHKIHGPKGIGGLYIRNGIKVHPLVYGGGQEGNFRSGTENVPGIFGLYEAVKEARDQLEENYSKVLGLKNYLLENLEEKIQGLHIHGDLNQSSPYILSLAVEGTRGEVLLHMLEQDEIYLSTASACSSHKKEGKNPIHQAIGLDSAESIATIRICLNDELSKEDMDVFLTRFKEHVETLQAIIGRC